eukprot:s7_g72.t1
MKRIGLVSESVNQDDEIPYRGKKKQLVKLLVNMIMATSLSGCADGSATWTSLPSSEGQGKAECQVTLMWLKVTIAVILSLVVLLVRTFYRFVDKKEQIMNFSTILRQVQEVTRFVNRGEDPVEQEWPFNSMFDGYPFEEHREKERPSPDEVVNPEMMANGIPSAGSADAGGGTDGGDHEAPLPLCRTIPSEAEHGAEDAGEANEAGGRDNDGTPSSADEDESFEEEETQPETPEAHAINNG